MFSDRLDRLPARVLAAAIFLTQAECRYIDRNDCDVAPDGSCEAYRPQGVVCGLVHSAWAWDLDSEGMPSYPGALCTFEGETTHPVLDRRDGCGDALDPLEPISDDESSGAWYGCAFAGNADRSAAELDEVPRGVACGLNTIGDAVATHNLCLDQDPSEGQCPSGFRIRFAVDRLFNCAPDEEQTDTDEEPCDTGATSADPYACPCGRPAIPQAHLLVWCELVDDGCVEGECELDFGGLCGLTPGVWDTIGVAESVLLEEEVASESPDLLGAYHDALDHLAANPTGDPNGSDTVECLGQTLPAGECPEGLDWTCIPDCTGSGVLQEGDEPEYCGTVFYGESWGGLCWCAPEGSALVYDHLSIESEVL